MTTAEAIVQRLESLPESLQREILDFIEFLETRRTRPGDRQDDLAWSEFSLASAMRGMEDEGSSYRMSDIRESRG